MGNADDSWLSLNNRSPSWTSWSRFLLVMVGRVLGSSWRVTLGYSEAFFINNYI